MWVQYANSHGATYDQGLMLLLLLPCVISKDGIDTKVYIPALVPLISVYRPGTMARAEI